MVSIELPLLPVVVNFQSRWDKNPKRDPMAGRACCPTLPIFLVVDSTRHAQVCELAANLLLLLHYKHI